MPVSKHLSHPTFQSPGVWMSRLVSLVLAICLVIAPSNLFLKFDQVNWAVRGLRVDYLLPKLYLSDLGLLATLGLLLVWHLRAPLVIDKAKSKLLAFCLALLVLAWLNRQAFTPYPIAALVGSIRLLTFIWVGWLVRLRWPTLKHSWLWWALVTSVIIQSSLALYQFLTQHSLGNYYWLLGEPDLAHTYNIVHGNFPHWGELILPYGTTAHPNILAGWVVGGWLLLLFWWREKLVNQNWQTQAVLTGVSFLTAEVVWLTQSWSAAGLAATGFIWFSCSGFISQLGANLRSKFTLPSLKTWPAGLGLGLLLLASPWWTNALQNLPWLSTMTQRSLSWDRRVWLSEAAIQLWQHQPLLGVGVNQFTAQLETVTHQTELVRFVQPVHQVGWLWLAETGILGVIILVGLIYLMQKNDPSFWSDWLTWSWISLPLLLWDHYLLTIPTGLWLSLWWFLPKSVLPKMPKRTSNQSKK